MCCCNRDCCGESCKYKGTCIRKLGWALIVLAVIGFILGVVADGVYAGYIFGTFHVTSAPIWGGAFVIVAGGLAVGGGKKPDNACLRIALLVMSIFGIMCAMLIWIFASMGLASDGTSCYWHAFYPSNYCVGIIALHALQVILGLAETVLMFILSIRSCCGTCCQGAQTKQPPTHAIIYQPGQPLSQQVYSGVIIMQTAPGVPGGQQPTYNPQTQAGSHPAQPQPGSYPAQPGSNHMQAGTYPTQAWTYPTQAGTNPTQAGAYPTQADVPPYTMVTDQKM